MTRLKRILCNLALTAVTCVAFLVLSEFAFRAVKINYGNPWAYSFDQELGWVPRANYSHDFPDDRHNQRPGPAEFRTNEYGFRHWGKLDSARPRFLFVGDSYTYPENVSNADTYYSYFASYLPAEVFVTGGSGYGTLQEIRLIKRYWEKLQPQYFVLQFCSNDFENNDLKMEDLSVARLQKNFRPYLVDGLTVYRDAPLFRLFARHSQLFWFLDQRVERLQVRLQGGWVPKSQAADLARWYPAAEAITLNILTSEYRPLADGVAAFTFTCNERDARARAAWLRVAKDAGLQPITGVAGSVEEAEDHGLPVRGADGAHWNDRGHEIVGKALVGFFRARLEADHRLVTDAPGAQRG
jgi:lysophospholipase L1-like esterase